MNELTPRMAAEIWKRSRGIQVKQAVIQVESLGRSDTFFLRDDVLEGEKDAPRFHFIAQGQWNGLCWCCGQVYTAAVISRLGAPDPGAGEEIPPEELEMLPIMIDKRITYVAAPYAATHACPDCAANNGMLTGTLQAIGEIDRETMTSVDTRDHPELAKYKDKPATKVEIRTRMYQMGYAEEILVWEYYRDDPRTWDYKLHVETGEIK